MPDSYFDSSGIAPPATKPGKNPMEPSGYTTRSPYGPAIPGIEDILRGAGGLARQQPAYNPTSKTYGALAGSQASDVSGLAGLLGTTGGPTNAQQNLSGMASEAGVDPYAERAFSAQRDKLANSINDRFSAAGRYASGDHASELGTSLGNATAGFMSDQWNAARQRQLQASGMIDAAGQAKTGMQAGILGNIANLQGSNFDRQLAALGGQTAAQGYEQDAPWAGLRNYAGILGPIAAGFGSQTNYDVPTPLWEKLLGGGISLLGGLGGMFK